MLDGRSPEILGGKMTQEKHPFGGWELWAMGHSPNLKEGASLVGVTGCFSDILIHSLPPSLCHSGVTEELENES